jgi:hypothetical protein
MRFAISKSEDEKSEDEAKLQGYTAGFLALFALCVSLGLLLYVLFSDPTLHEGMWGPRDTWRSNDYIQECRYVFSRGVLAGYYVTSHVWPAAVALGVLVGAGVIQRKLSRPKAKMLVLTLAVSGILMVGVMALSFSGMLIGPLIIPLPY